MAQPRIYTAQYAPAATTTATDLFEITCATDRPIAIIGWTIYQTTDLGDAAEEVLTLTVERGVTAGSGGSSATPADVGGRGESSSDATVNRSVTTAHTGGTVVLRKGWNIRIPEEFWLPEILWPYFDAGTDPATLTMSAPTDSITVGGAIYWAEF
jgi:hypothetical protein